MYWRIIVLFAVFRVFDRCGFRDGFAHIGVGLDVLHTVVVHNAEISVAESFGHCQRHFGLGLDNLGAGFLCLCLHLLLLSDSHSAAFLSLSLCNVLVGVGLVHLQLCTDVLSNVDVGDIN